MQPKSRFLSSHPDCTQVPPVWEIGAAFHWMPNCPVLEGNSQRLISCRDRTGRPRMREDWSLSKSNAPGREVRMKRTEQCAWDGVGRRKPQLTDFIKEMLTECPLWTRRYFRPGNAVPSPLVERRT